MSTICPKQAKSAVVELLGGIWWLVDVKPKGRSRKPQPATLSMFERALTLEQEREPESVGAGC